MERLSVIAGVIVCLAIAAGCGNKGTTSTALPTYSDISTFTLISTASGDLLGGAIQKGPFSKKLANYSTISGPTFTHISSVFSGPISVTTDGTSHYAVNYQAHNVIKIDPAGVVTTFAGKGIAGFNNISSSINAKEAYFYSPTAITTDGVLFYVADSSNHAIRKIDTTTSPAKVTVLAGTGTAGIEDTNSSQKIVAKFNYPTGLTVVGTNVFVVDSNNHTIRMIDTVTKQVTTLAGYPGIAGNMDGDRKNARFNQPARIASDGTKLYVTDFGNKTVRRINLKTGLVDTIAGIGGVSGSVDGPRGISVFNHPNGIATDGVNVYVSDSFEGSVRKISLTGNFTTTRIMGGLNTPMGLTTNGTTLYVTDRNAQTIVRIK